MGGYRKPISTLLDYCIVHGQKKGIEFRPAAYTTYGASYKIFVRLAGLEVSEPTSKLGNKWSDRYKTVGRKVGLREGITFPSNPDTLIDKRLFRKMIQNLFDYYGYDLDAADFITGSGTLPRGKMSQVIDDVINAMKDISLSF